MSVCVVVIINMTTMILTRSPSPQKREVPKVKRETLWDIPPIGFENVTPKQYKEMRGWLISFTIEAYYLTN